MDKIFNKTRNFRQARVAQKHLAKPEPQKVTLKRRLRPISESERAEILNRLTAGELLRHITSEMGVPYPLAFKLMNSAGITQNKGRIQHIRVYVSDGKVAAALVVNGIVFAIPPQVYGQFSRLIDQAYIEHLALLITAHWQDENFVVLHLRRGHER
jgi:hypothetical protein